MDWSVGQIHFLHPVPKPAVPRFAAEGCTGLDRGVDRGVREIEEERFFSVLTDELHCLGRVPGDDAALLFLCEKLGHLLVPEQR